MIDRPTLPSLGPAETLQAAATARRNADREEADLLAIAVHYVHLHPVTNDQPAAQWEVPQLRVHDPATNTLPAATAPLAGDGTPQVAEYAVEELAAALGLGYHTALHLVADA